MKVVILDRKVRQNIALFRHLIHRQEDRTRKFFQTAKKTYKGFIHKNSGEMRFLDPDTDQKLTDEWKPIVIRLRPDPDGAFEVYGEGETNQFDCQSLDPSAYVALTKTLHILNQIAFDPKKGKNPFWILKHLAVLDLGVADEEQSEREFIHRAWHNIDRERAEELLEELEVGAYLFRKDEFAFILEDTLNVLYEDPVICITLIFRDWDQKIREKTLVLQSTRWLVFEDDLTLPGERFDNIQAILASFEVELRTPVIPD